MKYFRVCISILFLTSTSLAYAKDLSINQERFVPGDNLVVTLAENWSGEADVYIAVSLPADDTLFFFTPPDFVLDFVPYIEVASASGSREIFQMVFPETGLPFGEYTFYAAAMQSGSFFDMVLDVTSTSFIFAAEAEKVFGVLSFGEDGTYKGCNGLQMAFNSVQDLDEIRIEQGTYECNGLSIPSSKSFEHGIKISGGWDSGFENQSDDPAITVFDGKEEGGILSVSADGSVAIEGLSFQNASDRAISANRKVSITNCIFTNNSASDDGGAVYYNDHSSGTITNSTFTNNSASSGGGGAVYSSSSSSTITNSTFTNNTASEGGAVFYSFQVSSGIISNSTFTNNSASENGGAVYYSYSSGTITNSTFTNNTSDSYGGAVSYYNYYSYSSGTITNSTFTNNSAKNNGGAVSGADTITNSTFTNNTASTGGVVNGSSTIVNCTIANNSGRGFSGSGTILNTLFAKNKVGEEANDITPSGELHVDYSLANYISGAVDLGTHNIMGEPRFVDADNGDFRLRADSPTVDVGDSSVIDSYSFLKDDAENEIDLDGNPRIVGGAIDLGAYELQ